MAKPHMTRAVIKNRTENALKNMVLVHQFGDHPAQTFTWNKPLEPFRQSSSVNVSFSTGFGSATDWDWWSLSWETNVGRQRCLHSTCPSMINIISDYFLMQGGIKASGSLAGHAASIAASSMPSTVVSSGVSAANELVNFAIGGIMRSVSKKSLINCNLHDCNAYVAGFKGSGIAFVVKPDSKIVIVTKEKNGEKHEEEFSYSSVAVPPKLKGRDLHRSNSDTEVDAPEEDAPTDTTS